MTTTRYALLAATVEDAKTHPAYSGAAVIVIGAGPAAKDGLIISGYVMTDAFYSECTRDDARGDAARSALQGVRRDVSRFQPVRTLRPATIAEVDVVGCL